MKIILVGDIIGEPGRTALTMLLPHIKKNNGIDLAIVNAENSAGGFGLTPKTADDIFLSGADIITLGNHTWDRKEVVNIIEHPQVLRPANYPPTVPGKGWTVFETVDKTKVAVINLMGRVFMSNLDCPFRTGELVVNKIAETTKNIIIDFHAEITSEKQAVGWFFDGKVSAVIGTHTHVQTSDERILSEGTAYITDVGMTGGRDGIIGMTKEPIIKKYLTQTPSKFEICKNDVIFQAVIIEIDINTGKSTKIERITHKIGNL